MSLSMGGTGDSVATAELIYVDADVDDPCQAWCNDLDYPEILNDVYPFKKRITPKVRSYNRIKSNKCRSQNYAIGWR